MNPRLRTVKTIKETVDEAIGEGELKDVFPLSPSSVLWGLQGGCTLQRYLGKAHGWRKHARMPHYVFLGSLVDHAFCWWLEQIQKGEDPTQEGVREVLYEKFFDERDGYEGWSEGFHEYAFGIAWAAIENIDFVPDTIQEECFLYLGDDPNVDIPTKYDEVRGNPDWIYGFTDWTLRQGKGVMIEDLKITGNPYKSIGKYRIQLFTYAAAKWQKGFDVRGIRLRQFDKNKLRFESPDEAFTRKDYDRVIQIYRAARDHFLGVMSGTQDFHIPYKGSGKCSQYGNCSFFSGCPLGAGNYREFTKC